MSKQYYFIGIKGTGMGPLAQILHDQGNEVLGSDIDTYTYTQAPLEAAGIKILPFEAKNVDEYQSAVFVRGNAFEDTHVEVARALELGVKMISYPEAVQSKLLKLLQLLSLARTVKHQLLDYWLMYSKTSRQPRI